MMQRCRQSAVAERGGRRSRLGHWNKHAVPIYINHTLLHFIYEIVVRQTPGHTYIGRYIHITTAVIPVAARASKLQTINPTATFNKKSWSENSLVTSLTSRQKYVALGNYK